MCRYKYQNESGNIIDKYCIYLEYFKSNAEMKELPIDADGYCLFHSKDKEWKKLNNFNSIFLKLLNSVIETNKSIINNSERVINFKGFIFYNDEGSSIIENIHTNQNIDFSNSIFYNGLKISNCTFRNFDIKNVTFKKLCVLKNVSFTDIFIAFNTVFNNLSIEDCKFDGQVMFENAEFNVGENQMSLRIKNDKNKIKSNNFSKSVLFTDTNFKGIVSFDTILFNGTCAFNNCKFENQTIFRYVELVKKFEFNNTVFLLPYDETGYMSTLDFFELLINEFAILSFKGNVPYQDVVTGELTIGLSKTSTGKLSFENFNLNKIELQNKERLLKLAQHGIVEIGKGCDKYRLKSAIIEKKASKSTIHLITELARVFSNFFEYSNGFSLGVEILEKTENLIKYFFFSDDKITKLEFNELIEQCQRDFWNLLIDQEAIGNGANENENTKIEKRFFKLDIENILKKTLEVINLKNELFNDAINSLEFNNDLKLNKPILRVYIDNLAVNYNSVNLNGNENIIIQGIENSDIDIK